MKIKVKLHSPIVNIKHHVSLSHDRLLHNIQNDKQEQLRKAVQYCLENNCKGYKAIQSGQFPLVKDPLLTDVCHQKCSQKVQK